jgi:hypothetical protein
MDFLDEKDRADKIDLLTENGDGRGHAVTGLIC